MGICFQRQNKITHLVDLSTFPTLMFFNNRKGKCKMSKKNPNDPKDPIKNSTDLVNYCMDIIGKINN